MFKPMKYRPVFHRLSLLLAALLLLLLFGGFRLLGMPDNGNPDSRQLSVSSEEIEDSRPRGGAESLSHTENQDLSATLNEPWNDPEQVIRAFSRAYPDRVSAIAFRRDDWALLVDGQWFYHAGGRMLPEELLDEAERYAPYSFYPYTPELRALREYSDEEVAELEARVESQASSGIGRHPGLTDALWGISDFNSSDRKVKTLYLFRRQVNVHRYLLEDLAEVEERIYELARDNSEIRGYVDSISTVTGHSWRPILGTFSRSLHSYGIAIDILPGRFTQAQVYWRWARQLGLPWYNLPYDQRMMPPMEFVREFEKAGFIWGGKWRRFDTIHFEYRPEIFELNRESWEHMSRG